MQYTVTYTLICRILGVTTGMCRLVGTHDVQATVTRVVEVEGGQDGTQEECLVVPVVIEDSNECTLPRDEPMRHE